MTLRAHGWKFPFDQRSNAAMANMARWMARDIRERQPDSQLAHWLTEAAKRLEP